MTNMTTRCASGGSITLEAGICLSFEGSILSPQERLFHPEKMLFLSFQGELLVKLLKYRGDALCTLPKQRFFQKNLLTSVQNVVLCT